MKHTDAPVRLWAVRLLGDEWGLNRNLGAGQHARFAAGHTPGQLPDALFDAMRQQARVETDAEVLAQMASTARRLNGEQALKLVAEVMRHDEVAHDTHVPLLCWWVVEAHIPTSNDAVASLMAEKDFWDEPMVFEHLLPRLARRYAVEGNRQDLMICAQLFAKAPQSKHADQLLKGLEEAYRGRSMTSLPDALVAGIKRSGHVPLIFRVKQGDKQAVAEAIALIQNTKATLEERLIFARAFGEVIEPDAVPALMTVASGKEPDELRKAAMASLAAYDRDDIGRRIATLLPDLKNDVRIAAFALLASRSAWSMHLLDAVKSDQIKAADVPEDIATRLRASHDKQVTDLAASVLPAKTPVPAEFQNRIDHVNAALAEGTGNPYAGEALFMQRCAACHKLFFKGGNVGPDLTAYQRDNLGTMLLSIVNPNAEIREGFAYYLVTMKDDRILSGFFVERDNQITVLRGLDGENVTLRADDIREVKPAGLSLMPAGLIDGLTDQQLRDFFAYMRISQPISK